MSVRTELTDEKLLALPDDGVIYEVIDGELITMSPAGPRHGRFAFNVAHALGNWLDAGHSGQVYIAETAFWLTPTTLQVPDVSYIATPLSADEEPEGFRDGAPDLAVEVVSPSERTTEVEDKVKLYLDAGAKQVWTLYPEPKTASVHTPDGMTQSYAFGDTLTGGDLLSGFSLKVADIFK